MGPVENAGPFAAWTLATMAVRPKRRLRDTVIFGFGLRLESCDIATSALPVANVMKLVGKKRRKDWLWLE